MLHEGEYQKGIKVNWTANRVVTQLLTESKGSGSQNQYSNAHNNGIEYNHEIRRYS